MAIYGIEHQAKTTEFYACDVCGHLWFGKLKPKRCPKRGCWSCRWNAQAKAIERSKGKPTHSPAIAAPTPKPRHYNPITHQWS